MQIRVLLQTVMVCAAALPCDAQSPSTSPPQQPAGAKIRRSLFIDVKELSSDRSAMSYGVTSKTRHFQKEKTYQVMVKNSGLEESFTIEGYFIAAPAGGEGRRVYDRHSDTATIKGGGLHRVEWSLALSSHTEKTYGTGRTLSRTGLRAEGWIVRIKAGDEVVAIKTSGGVLDSIIRDPAQMAALTGQ
jgi:hypothetical protein